MNRSKRERGRPRKKDPVTHLPNYTIKKSTLEAFQGLIEKNLDKSPSQHLDEAIRDYIRTYGPPLRVTL